MGCRAVQHSREELSRKRHLSQHGASLHVPEEDEDEEKDEGEEDDGTQSLCNKFQPR